MSVAFDSALLYVHVRKFGYYHRDFPLSITIHERLYWHWNCFGETRLFSPVVVVGGQVHKHLSIQNQTSKCGSFVCLMADGSHSSSWLVLRGRTNMVFGILLRALDDVEHEATTWSMLSLVHKRVIPHQQSIIIYLMSNLFILFIYY